MMPHGVDTSPKILAYDKRYYSNGSVIDHTGRCVTVLYPVNYGDVSQPLLHYGLQFVLVCFKNNGATFIDYWSTNSTSEEKTNGVINAGSDCIGATIQMDMIDVCYLINSLTGDIIFAGKNSIYYGHRNISELN